MSRDIIECSNCRCFEATGYDIDGAPIGECRIEPPKAQRDGTRALWPIVYETDWCGKFQSEVEL